LGERSSGQRSWKAVDRRKLPAPTNRHPEKAVDRRKLPAPTNRHLEKAVD
jgi:hypothetical protein